MVSIDLYYYTDEEAEALIAEYYTEEEKQVIQEAPKYVLNENWEKWKLIQDRFPIKRYIICAHHFEDDPHFQQLYLIDILKTAWILQKNYRLFKETVGYDFDPFEIVHHIQDEENLFWKRVLYNQENPNGSVLYGLLFGFGEKNSWAFTWNARYFLNNGKGIEYFPRNFSDSNYLPISNQNFPIPIFRSFTDEGKDEIVEKYKKEREEIKKVLRKRDFVEIVLEKLTS